MPALEHRLEVGKIIRTLEQCVANEYDVIASVQLERQFRVDRINLGRTRRRLPIQAELLERGIGGPSNGAEQTEEREEDAGKFHAGKSGGHDDGEKSALAAMPHRRHCTWLEVERCAPKPLV
jgi:hypothetical protein